MSINRRLAELEKGFRRKQLNVDVHPDIRMLYHENTLAQLVYLRSILLRRPMSQWARADFMIAGATAGILHGAHRADGSSQYLSISMPNTFSMSPSYVERFIREKSLVRPDQNVFERLRDKVARLYLDDAGPGAGSTTHRDANTLLAGKALGEGSIHLLLTSPPYLDVVNYGTSNWIRLWWLGLDDVGRDTGAGRIKLNAKLDHQHNFASYQTFMLQTFKGTRRVLAKGGVAVFVIGDVAAPSRPPRAIATEVWDAIGHKTGLRLLDVIEDSLATENKVSRIWGDTKGKATDRDCVLILSRADGEPRTDAKDIDWAEPYKDGGTDAAHARVHRRRRGQSSEQQPADEDNLAVG